MAKAKINHTLHKTLLATFVQLLMDMKNPREIYYFLRDFLTDEELDKFITRLGAAYWLKKKRTSENIQNNLKVSKAEIESIKKTMETEGLKTALKYIEAEEWANVWEKRIKSFAKK